MTHNIDADRIEANRGVSSVVFPNNTVARATDPKLVNALARFAFEQWRQVENA